MKWFPAASYGKPVIRLEQEKALLCQKHARSCKQPHLALHHMFEGAPGCWSETDQSSARAQRALR